RVLDIGCGWGGLAIYLAQECGVEVTGLTLSVEQHKVAERRAADAGLADRVRFFVEDYRAHRGRYDRIVSVGMFEHVGVPHYRDFFGAVKSLLDDAGVALLHSIGRMTGPGVTNPWIRKYIFPGGYSPALSEVASRHQGHLVFQMQMAKSVSAVPMTRDYMLDWERSHRAPRAERAA